MYYSHQTQDNVRRLSQSLSAAIATVRFVLLSFGSKINFDVGPLEPLPATVEDKNSHSSGM